MFKLFSSNSEERLENDLTGSTPQGYRVKKTDLSTCQDVDGLVRYTVLVEYERIPDRPAPRPEG